MPEWLLFVGILGTAYLGFALLALGQRKHRRAVMSADLKTTPFRSAVPRCLGILALTTSFALALFQHGPSFGSLLWATVLSIGAVAVALTLAWRPKWLRPLASCLF